MFQFHGGDTESSRLFSPEVLCFVGKPPACLLEKEACGSSDKLSGKIALERFTF